MLTVGYGTNLGGCKLQFNGEIINEQNVQTVGAAGIPARGIAARYSAIYSSMQCRGQELKVSGAKRKANAHGSYN